MEKTIKFNLILDGQPVRDLDDLQEHFNIEDLLVAYRNGLLGRWLETRELVEQSAALEKIHGNADAIAVAQALCRVFNKEADREQIEAAAWPFMFREEEAKKIQIYQDLKNQKEKIINDYHDGYGVLCCKLAKHSDNAYYFVKSAIEEIAENYMRLYLLEKDAFYRRYIEKKPLVILAILANKDMCESHRWDLQGVFYDLFYFDPVDFMDKWKKDSNQQGVAEISKREENGQLRARCLKILVLECQSRRELEGEIVNSNELSDDVYPLTYIPVRYLEPRLPAYVKTFSGETAGYWKDMEAKGKRCLIIKISPGDLVRNIGKNGEELTADDINGKFLILDGIDYKSNDADHQLVYMEI